MAAELGGDDPRIVAAAVEVLGVEITSDEQAEALGEAIKALGSARPPGSSLDPKFAEGAEQFRQFDEQGFNAGAIRGWAADGLTGRDVRDLGAALEEAQPGGEVLRDFRNYFRTGVDESLNRSRGKRYEWVALTIAMLSVVATTTNASAVIVSLPPIFRGIRLDPLVPGHVAYLLWMLAGYLMVPAVLMPAMGRLGDNRGRVRLFTLGFAVFGLAALALAADPLHGPGGALWLIGWRIVQAVGATMLMANTVTVLLDVFPDKGQRARALGIFGLVSATGSIAGLVIGGLLAAANWRLVFAAFAPIGIGGALWSYLSLRETGTRPRQRIDWLGTGVFALALVGVLAGLTYGLQPYAGDVMGWTSPATLTCLAGGVALVAVFCLIELRVASPIFDLTLLRIRPFAGDSATALLAAIGGGGLQFVLIIWLEGIWLVLHGYSPDEIPLWAGIYLLPLAFGALIASGVSGSLTARYGPRWFAAGGLGLEAAAVTGLALLPADFPAWAFAVLTFAVGVGVGAFTSADRQRSSARSRRRGAAPPRPCSSPSVTPVPCCRSRSCSRL